jgi:hypothetical protein
MARLTARDYGAALEFLKFAGDVGGPDPFPEPVLERLRLLVGCDCVSYGEYAGRAVRRRNIRAAPAGFLPVSPEVARAHDRLRHRSPLLPRTATLDRPVRLSDCLTRREIRSHPLYEPVWRRLGSKNPMTLWLTDRGRILGGFGFDSASRDFTARDKLVLETLVPHLVQLHRAARARAAATGETEATQALTAPTASPPARSRRRCGSRPERCGSISTTCSRSSASGAARPRSPSPSASADILAAAR